MAAPNRWEAWAPTQQKPEALDCAPASARTGWRRPPENTPLKWARRAPARADRPPPRGTAVQTTPGRDSPAAAAHRALGREHTGSMRQRPVAQDLLGRLRWTCASF